MALVKGARRKSYIPGKCFAGTMNVERGDKSDKETGKKMVVSYFPPKKLELSWRQKEELLP